MNVRFATDDEIAVWNEMLGANPDHGNVFSSREMAETKADYGWTPRYVIAGTVAILALEKSIPLLGKFWYLPKGPGVTTTKELHSLLESFKAFAKTQGVFVAKIEPEILSSDESCRELVQMGLERTFAVQPNVSTVLVDLQPDETDILAGFSQSTRRMIRQAEKDAVEIKPVEPTAENCATMYAMYQETASGQFGIRPAAYYQTYWQMYAKRRMGQLYLAYKDDVAIAGVYVLWLGQNALYKDGASPRTKVARGVGQAIQWYVMRDLKKRGVAQYDMHGAPTAARIDDTDDPKYRLGIFKTGFNKTITEYVGAYNLPVRAEHYRLWAKFGERLILKLHRVLAHSEWY